MGSWTFAYDHLNRLLSGTPTSGVYSGQGQELCLAYDSFGNRTQSDLQAAACGPSDAPTAKYSAANQVTFTAANGAANGFAYDAAGDVTFDGANYYAYDAEGRVCAMQTSPISGGTVAWGYLYDAEGRRAAKGSITPVPLGQHPSCDPATNGFALTESYVLGQGGEQLTTTSWTGGATGAGTWQSTNVYAGGKLIAAYDAATSGAAADAGSAGGLHFQLTDPLGTRRVQANSAGEAELDCQSLPFGDQLSCFPDPNAPGGDQDEDATGMLTGIHFTGKERDTESGLDYFGARYYGSSMGRFISPDNGIDQDTSDPQSLNLYSNVRNNPLNRIDPNGRMTIIVPGTNWSSANWNDNMKLVNEAREAFHDPDVRILDWSGSLTNGARLDGASMLSDMVSGHTFAPGEQLNVIGHSRGGEVALDATPELSHKIDNLITLDAPAGDDVVPNMANIGNWINVSVAQDWVQYLNSAFGTSPRQQSGAHNLTLNAPQYGHIASHSAVWQDDSLRSQWWRFWGQNGGCQDSWNPKTNTLTGCP